MSIIRANWEVLAIARGIRANYSGYTDILQSNRRDACKRVIFPVKAYKNIHLVGFLVAIFMPLLLGPEMKGETPIVWLIEATKKLATLIWNGVREMMQLVLKRGTKFNGFFAPKPQNSNISRRSIGNAEGMSPDQNKGSGDYPLPTFPTHSIIDVGDLLHRTGQSAGLASFAPLLTLIGQYRVHWPIIGQIDQSYCFFGLFVRFCETSDNFLSVLVSLTSFLIA
jgi:hypothetical protein